MSALTRLPAWKSLQQHVKTMENIHLRDLFASDPDRCRRFSFCLGDTLFDFSKHRMTDLTLQHLVELAHQCNLKTKITAMFQGEAINTTENRAVLHTALRNRSNQPVLVDGKNVMPEVNAVLEQMRSFSERVREGQWRGATGKPICDVVNIGIGGSDLGPLMVTEALKPYRHERLKVHFVSNVDATHLTETLRRLNPETTLFLIASKTFTTQETMTNAHSARRWLVEQLGDENAVSRHFVAISTNREKVCEFGIDPANMFVFWDWVGGRYSMWSAIGFPIALKVGMKGFYQMLEGANLMDDHFATTPLAKNIPVIMGLVDVWNINFLNIHAKAILPYDARLKYLPPYFEQLVMESNGKSVNRAGDKFDYKTCPILWGEVGPNAQHAFYQLLHQGTQAVMSDFIVPVERDDFERYSGAEKDASLLKQHHLALANCFAQSRVLMLGDAAIPDSLKASFNSPYKHYEGNQPSNTILLKTLSAKTLGMLVALYEHKTFVESVVWEINPFDQWGVELGKKLAGVMLSDIKSGKISEHDSSTAGLLEEIRQK